MLKHKYFIHHYLSIALFCLSTIAYDLILNNYYVYFDNSYWLQILFLLYKIYDRYSSSLLLEYNLLYWNNDNNNQ